MDLHGYFTEPIHSRAAQCLRGQPIWWNSTFGLVRPMRLIFRHTIKFYYKCRSVRYLLIILANNKLPMFRLWSIIKLYILTFDNISYRHIIIFNILANFNYLIFNRSQIGLSFPIFIYSNNYVYILPRNCNSVKSF